MRFFDGSFSGVTIVAQSFLELRPGLGAVWGAFFWLAAEGGQPKSRHPKRHQEMAKIGARMPYMTVTGGGLRSMSCTGEDILLMLRGGLRGRLPRDLCADFFDPPLRAGLRALRGNLFRYVFYTIQ